MSVETPVQRDLPSQGKPASSSLSPTLLPIPSLEMNDKAIPTKNGTMARLPTGDVVVDGNTYTEVLATPHAGDLYRLHDAPSPDTFTLYKNSPFAPVVISSDGGEYTMLSIEGGSTPADLFRLPLSSPTAQEIPEPPHKGHQGYDHLLRALALEPLSISPSSIELDTFQPGSEALLTRDAYSPQHVPSPTPTVQEVFSTQEVQLPSSLPVSFTGAAPIESSTNIPTTKTSTPPLPAHSPDVSQEVPLPREPISIQQTLAHEVTPVRAPVEPPQEITQASTQAMTALPVMLSPKEQTTLQEISGQPVTSPPLHLPSPVTQANTRSTHTTKTERETVTPSRSNLFLSIPTYPKTVETRPVEMKSLQAEPQTMSPTSSHEVKAQHGYSLNRIDQVRDSDSRREALSQRAHGDISSHVGEAAIRPGDGAFAKSQELRMPWEMQSLSREEWLTMQNVLANMDGADALLLEQLVRSGMRDLAEIEERLREAGYTIPVYVPGGLPEQTRLTLDKLLASLHTTEEGVATFLLTSQERRYLLTVMTVEQVHETVSWAKKLTHDMHPYGLTREHIREMMLRRFTTTRVNGILKRVEQMQVTGEDHRIEQAFTALGIQTEHVSQYAARVALEGWKPGRADRLVAEMSSMTSHRLNQSLSELGLSADTRGELLFTFWMSKKKEEVRMIIQRLRRGVYRRLSQLLEKLGVEKQERAQLLAVLLLRGARERDAEAWLSEIQSEAYQSLHRVLSAIEASPQEKSEVIASLLVGGATQRAIEAYRVRVQEQWLQSVRTLLNATQQGRTLLASDVVIEIASPGRGTRYQYSTKTIYLDPAQSVMEGRVAAVHEWLHSQHSREPNATVEERLRAEAEVIDETLKDCEAFVNATGRIQATADAFPLLASYWVWQAEPARHEGTSLQSSADWLLSLLRDGTLRVSGTQGSEPQTYEEYLKTQRDKAAMPTISRATPGYRKYADEELAELQRKQEKRYARYINYLLGENEYQTLSPGQRTKMIAHIEGSNVYELLQALKAVTITLTNGEKRLPANMMRIEQSLLTGIERFATLFGDEVIRKLSVLDLATFSLERDALVRDNFDKRTLEDALQDIYPGYQMNKQSVQAMLYRIGSIVDWMHSQEMNGNPQAVEQASLHILSALGLQNRTLGTDLSSLTPPLRGFLGRGRGTAGTSSPAAATLAEFVSMLVYHRDLLYTDVPAKSESKTPESELQQLMQRAISIRAVYTEEPLEPLSQLIRLSAFLYKKYGEELQQEAVFSRVLTTTPLFNWIREDYPHMIYGDVPMDSLSSYYPLINADTRISEMLALYRTALSPSERRNYSLAEASALLESKKEVFQQLLSRDIAEIALSNKANLNAETAISDLRDIRGNPILGLYDTLSEQCKNEPAVLETFEHFYQQMSIYSLDSLLRNAQHVKGNNEALAKLFASLKLKPDVEIALLKSIGKELTRKQEEIIRMTNASIALQLQDEAMDVLIRMFTTQNEGYIGWERDPRRMRYPNGYERETLNTPLTFADNLPIHGMASASAGASNFVSQTSFPSLLQWLTFCNPELPYFKSLEAIQAGHVPLTWQSHQSLLYIVEAHLRALLQQLEEHHVSLNVQYQIVRTLLPPPPRRDASIRLDGAELGDGHFMNVQELFHEFMREFDEATAIPFGEYRGFKVFLSGKDRFRHIMGVAASGMGKTTYIVNPFLFHAITPFTASDVMDPKGEELFRTSAPHLQKDHILGALSLIEGRQSLSVNPLTLIPYVELPSHLLRGRELEQALAAIEVPLQQQQAAALNTAATIVENSVDLSMTHPDVRKLVKNVLAATMLHIRETTPRAPYSALQAYVDLGIRALLSILKTSPSPVARRLVEGLKEELAQNEPFTNAMVASIHHLRIEIVRARSRTNWIDPRAFVDDRYAPRRDGRPCAPVLFHNMSTEDQEELSTFVAVVLDAKFYAAIKHLETGFVADQNHYSYFLCGDEAGQYVLPGLGKRLALIRSLDMGVLLAVQSRGMLERPYGPEFTSIWANTGVKLFRGGASLDDLEEIARMMGLTTKMLQEMRQVAITFDKESLHPTTSELARGYHAASTPVINMQALGTQSWDKLFVAPSNLPPFIVTVSDELMGFKDKERDPKDGTPGIPLVPLANMDDDHPVPENTLSELEQHTFLGPEEGSFYSENPLRNIITTEEDAASAEKTVLGELREFMAARRELAEAEASGDVDFQIWKAIYALGDQELASFVKYVEENAEYNVLVTTRNPHRQAYNDPETRTRPFSYYLERPIRDENRGPIRFEAVKNAIEQIEDKDNGQELLKLLYKKLRRLRGTSPRSSTSDRETMYRQYLQGRRIRRVFEGRDGSTGEGAGYMSQADWKEALLWFQGIGLIESFLDS